MNGEIALETGNIPARITAAARPFVWSVRRELWENRFLWIAPLVVAGVVLVVFLFNTPVRMQDVKGGPVTIATKPYDFASFALIGTGFMVSVFYCLDALYGDRRDRSILFWKSLPVSDAAAVLSKAAIPLAVLPVIVFVIVLTTHLVMLSVDSLLLFGDWQKVAALWARMHWGMNVVSLLYIVPVIMLWYTPIYGLLLLISAWARRAPFLWAGLPLIVACLADRFILDSKYVLPFLYDRMCGWFWQALDVKTHAKGMSEPIALDPLKFVTSPGLWWGLVFAAACLYGATRLRRYRGPI